MEIAPDESSWIFGDSFGNSRKHVYINIHNAFPAIMTYLEGYDPKFLNNKEGIIALNSRLEEKGEKAQELRGKILMQFLLNLSGLADVYEQFGAVFNVAQMVHLLPHKRYELYMKVAERLDMII